MADADPRRRGTLAAGVLLSVEEAHLQDVHLDALAVNHDRDGGDSAKIEIAGGEVIAGSLPGRGLRLVREWFEEHRGELETNWERAVHHERPHPIDPLR